MIDKKPCCQSYQFNSYSIISLLAVLSPQTITDHHHELIVIHYGYERIWNGWMNAAYPAPFLPHHPHLWGLWCERWIQGCLGFGTNAFILAMNNTPRSSTGITILGYELEVLISLLPVLSCTGLGWLGPLIFSKITEQKIPTTDFPRDQSPSDMDWSLCDEISCLGMSWQQFEQDDSMALDPLPWNLWHLTKSPVFKHRQHTSLLQLVHDVPWKLRMLTVYPSCWIANLHRPWIIAQCPPCWSHFRRQTWRQGKVIGPSWDYKCNLIDMFHLIIESKMLHII